MNECINEGRNEQAKPDHMRDKAAVVPFMLRLLVVNDLPLVIIRE